MRPSRRTARKAVRGSAERCSPNRHSGRVLIQAADRPAAFGVRPTQAVGARSQGISTPTPPCPVHSRSWTGAMTGASHGGEARACGPKLMRSSQRPERNPHATQTQASPTIGSGSRRRASRLGRCRSNELRRRTAARRAATRAGLRQDVHQPIRQRGGLRQHIVIGGDGPPLLLVHGWPENWYQYRA
jgi:hypothetical protein